MSYTLPFRDWDKASGSVIINCWYISIMIAIDLSVGLSALYFLIKISRKCILEYPYPNCAYFGNGG